jgi:GTP-binding protein
MSDSEKPSRKKNDVLPEPGQNRPPKAAFRYHHNKTKGKKKQDKARSSGTKKADYKPFGQAKFILSAPERRFCPESELPEICLAGRSNVGKSSLVNALTQRLKLAKTSNVPGKTREMNYFLMNERWYLVDLPGYGYARVPPKEQKRWKEALEDYLLNRAQLRLIILIVDIRHEPHASDLDFMYWLGHHQLPFAIVLNKADKIGKQAVERARMRIKEVQQEMNIEVPVVATSIQTLHGMKELSALLADFTSDP